MGLVQDTVISGPHATLCTHTSQSLIPRYNSDVGSMRAWALGSGTPQCNCMNQMTLVRRLGSGAAVCLLPPALTL